MRTVSIIIVNYNTAGMVREAVLSLLPQQGPELALDLLVVDNASQDEDREVLKTVPGVRLLFLDENLGFSRANNEALHLAEGEYVFFLNPDTFVYPHAVEILADAFDAHPNAGAVGPRVWWDLSRTLQLPPTRLPAPSLDYRLLFAASSPWTGANFRKRITAENLRFWAAQTPLEVPALAGANILTHKRILDRIGPFDHQTFFMYFEDADWCLRLRKQGYRIVTDPRAEIVHLYNQSGRQNPEASERLFQESRRKYMAKHYGRMPALGHRLLHSSLKALVPHPIPKEFAPLADVTPETTFPSSEQSAPERFLFQMSVNPLMFPSAGALVQSSRFRIPEQVFTFLAPGRYFATITDLDSMAQVGAWTWFK